MAILGGVGALGAGVGKSFGQATKGGGGGQAAANSAAQKKAKKKGGGGGVLKPVEIIDPQPVNIFTPATIIKQKKKAAPPPKPAQAKTGNTVLTSTFNSAGKQLLGQ